MNSGKVKKNKQMSSMVTDRFLEVFDRQAVLHMLRYREYYKTLLKIKDSTYEPFVLLEKYFKKAGGDRKNMVGVLYDRKNGRGRRFARDGLSMQLFHTGIRGLMAKNHYWDVDFVNCHPVIVEQLSKVNGIYMSSLPEYIDNREKVFQDIIDANPELSREFVKKAILSVLYGGNTNFNKIKIKTDWMNRFQTEIKKLHQAVPRLFPDEYELQSELKGANYFNLAGSTLSAVVCVEEDRCLQVLLNYLKKKLLISKANIGVLCFDGVMVYNKTFRGEPVPEKSIEDAIQTVQDQIKNDYGYPLKLKIKPFECLPTTVPQKWVDRIHKAEQEQKNKKICDYVNDPYYWMDFVKDVICVTHDSFEALTDAFNGNINRVMFRVFKFEKHLIRKINRENMFQFEDCTPRDVLLYRDIDARGNPIVKRITFGKLLYDTGLINFIDVYDDIDFKPYSELLGTPPKTDPRKFNMWTGFQAKLLPKEDVVVTPQVKMILDHIKLCWAAGDEHIYNYLLTWFKTIFTCPGKKSKVALVLKSTDKQVGKGIIINEFLIPLVFGKQYSMSEAGLESVVSRFNKIMMNKIFINCDELSSLDAGFHQAFDILKKRITDGTISIEIKGGRKFIYPDYSNYIFCTNHDFTIKLEQGDVRYLVLECSSVFKSNYAYFNELFGCFTQETANLFYSYICYVDTGIVDIRNVPMTSLKRNMIINSMQSPSRFLLDVQNGDYTVRSYEVEVSEVVNPVWITASELYREYEDWVVQNNEKKLSKRKFLDDIKGKIEKKRSNGFKYNITTGVDVVLG